MGYILNGVYYRCELTKSSSQDTTVENIYTASNAVRQYERHAHDLIQPYNPDGTPNKDFIDYYESDAKRYGFIPDDNSSEPIDRSSVVL